MGFPVTVCSRFEKSLIASTALAGILSPIIDGAPATLKQPFPMLILSGSGIMETLSELSLHAEAIAMTEAMTISCIDFIWECMIIIVL